MLGSRLHAAAGALFPPEGEEKKSKVERERHRRKGYRLCRLNVNSGGGGLLSHPLRCAQSVTVTPVTKPSLVAISFTSAAGTAMSVVTTIAANGS